MSVTAEQLYEELSARHNTLTHAWGNVWGTLEEDLYGAVTIPSGTLKRVHQEGGEGQGTEYFYVFSIGDQLFRVDGYYASWDGTTYDDGTRAISEVEAVPTVVIQYNRK